MKCMYCEVETLNQPMYVVREAVKPKHSPYRWKKIGYCCERCEAEGKPTKVDYSWGDCALYPLCD